MGGLSIDKLRVLSNRLILREKFRVEMGKNGERRSRQPQFSVLMISIGFLFMYRVNKIFHNRGCSIRCRRINSASSLLI